MVVKAAFGDGFLYVIAPSHLFILTNRCSLTAAAFGFLKGKKTVAHEEKPWIAAKIQKNFQWSHGHYARPESNKCLKCKVTFDDGTKGGCILQN